MSMSAGGRQQEKPKCWFFQGLLIVYLNGSSGFVAQATASKLFLEQPKPFGRLMIAPLRRGGGGVRWR